MSAPALIEARTARVFSHRELKDWADRYSVAFGAGKTKRLVLLVTANRAAVIAALQGARQAGHAILLADAATSAPALQKLIALYEPEILAAPKDFNLADQGDYEAIENTDGLAILARKYTGPPPHPDLAFLLTTSGSTGNSKLVRLSRQNIETNMAAIIEALGIRPEDRAAAHMPLAYSYGLSVALTHLAAGASLLLIEDGMTENAFWQAMRDHKATTLPGVPYHFALIERFGLERLKIPDLHTMIQAGGRMEPKSVRRLAQEMQERKGRFFVMYGQTEAAPRMTTLPAACAVDRPGSVGLPLAQGKIAIEDGEVVYRGPNVMMGYAESRADLARGDGMRGRLATGDLGHIDEKGFLYLTGRKKRFAKIDGLRIGLDDIESIAAAVAPAAALEHNEQVVLFTSGEAEAVRGHVLARVRLHASRLACRAVAELPRLANGKIDAQTLKEWLS